MVKERMPTREDLIIIIIIPITHRVPVVSPRTKLHEASLLVKGEVLHVDLAKWFIDGRRFPHDLPRMVQNCLGHNGHLVVAIGAENKINVHPDLCPLFTRPR